MVNTPSLQQGELPQKVHRSSAPKVKTGCKACKAAHVRCDEQKPACGRCQRRRLACIFAKVLPRREKLTQQEQQPFKVTLWNAERPTQPVRLVEPPIIAMTPEDATYFDKFHHHIALQSVGSEFWRRTVLRESVSDECVRSCIIALGALTRAQETQHGSRRPLFVEMNATVTMSSGARNHYYRALSHYTKAIGALGRTMRSPEGGNKYRSILIATTLLVLFEFTQGNTEAADQLSAHCVALLRGVLMEGRLARNDKSSTSLIANCIDDEGVCEAEIELVRNACVNAAFSPFYARTRLILLGLPAPSTGGSHPPALDESIATFTREWTRTLTLVSLWYFRIRTSAFMIFRKGNNPRETAKYEAFLAVYRREQHIILHLLESWKTAVEMRIVGATFYDHVQYSGIAVAIEVCEFSVRTAFNLTGKPWEGFESAVEDLLTRCEAIVLSDTLLPKGATHLKEQGLSHGGLVTAISQIAQESRLPNLRQRALNIARHFISKKAHWDAQGVHLGMKALIEAEEKARDPLDGSIPLTAQRFCNGGFWNHDYTKFKVTLVKKLLGSDGKPIREVVTMPAVYA